MPTVFKIKMILFGKILKAGKYKKSFGNLFPDPVYPK
jgi:hypothetical protein